MGAAQLQGIGMGDLVTLNRISLEEVLKLPEWGYWAYKSEDNLSHSVPGWTNQIIGDPWKQEEDRFGPIDPDYALKLDREIAFMEDDAARKILIYTYVYRRTTSAIQRVMKMKYRDVNQLRDSALSYLYGRMCG